MILQTPDYSFLHHILKSLPHIFDMPKSQAFLEEVNVVWDGVFWWYDLLSLYIHDGIKEIELVCFRQVKAVPNKGRVLPC